MRSTSTPRCAAGDLLARLHLVDGRLRRVSRDGRVGAPAGVLEDHGAVAGGFLALCGATGDERWLTVGDRPARRGARALPGRRRRLLRHPADGERLVARPRDPSDNASPSGTSATIHALLAAHALTGDGRWRDAAEEALATVATLARRAPRFAGWSLAAAQALLDGAPEIAVVGPAGPARDDLERRARSLAGGGGGRRRPRPARRTAAGGARRRSTDGPRRTSAATTSVTVR